MQIRYMNFYTFDQFQKQSSNSDADKFEEDLSKKNYLQKIKFEDIETVYLLTSRRTEGTSHNETISDEHCPETEPKVVAWKTEELKREVKKQKKIQKLMYDKLAFN